MKGLPALRQSLNAVAHLESLVYTPPAGTLFKEGDAGYEDVYRFVGFALGTHGHAGLKFLGAIHYGTARSDLEAAAQCAGVPKTDILLAEWRGELHHPGYFLAIDHQSKSLVLALRGSLFPQDGVTDLTCMPREFSFQGQKGHAHSGMLTAAERLSEELAPTVVSLLESQQYLGFRLIVTGHSLGAGVAGLLSCLWLDEESPLGRHREVFRCVAYGMPAVLSPELAAMMNSQVTSVVCGRDVVPCLSLRSCTRLRDAVLQLWRTPGEAERLLAFTDEDNAAETLETLMNVSNSPTNDILLSQPGRVIWAPPEEDAQLLVVRNPVQAFQDLPLSGTVFQPHLPQNYAWRLGGAICGTNGDSETKRAKDD
eukprot:TRINITY_DN11448_c0_g1_i2.p1 TRINITY_DN11448_c0_g1~~TRINITY_DN11448_c0_g1_i2.p1  ORF type:complete len:368 (+),score=34.04 TRINITY_DN11448_c0_g1_i2:409-1512(+)